MERNAERLLPSVVVAVWVPTRESSCAAYD